ncbi:hypothetical protein SAMN05444422_10519 [Halobiforma haloterrestris]|uniref:Coiled-coil protein n=1 Tax=Natronobacterium haloterrestre TaxID=148448 RepID=A0A1I1GTX3_NATHA|nr:hypothetical protein [Halobiforma haloterrestris]SFC14936.1 hypothetical protein SAMN05444422_10519 [Halobiforma haloterrestris]
MNGNVKTAAGIGLLVVLAAAIGAGIFVWSGSQAATWFVLVGIPLIVVVGITLYVRGVVARSGTSEQQFVRTRARSVAEEFQECVRRVNDLEAAYPNWSPGVDARLESIEGDFRTEGVTFDLESGAFDLGKGVKSADLQTFEQLSTEIESVDAEIESSFREFGAAEQERVDDGLERLAEVDLASADRGSSPELDPEKGATVPECRDAIDGLRADATDEIEAAIGTVREMGRGDVRPDDADAVERDLEDAESALERYEFDTAVDRVLEARDRLRDQFSGSFESERESLLDLIDAVDRADVDAYVDAEYVDDVDRIESEVESLDSALDLAELSRPRADLRRTCIDMIATMERDLEDDVRTLREADLPPGYYAEPDVVGERFVDELEEIDDLDALADRWSEVATQLRDALETANTKAAVVDAYDDVADTIETTLEREGEVTGDDLPMRHADQFLGLYFRRNDGVEFDPDVPVLRRGDVETSELAVEVTYERGGDVRTATLELTDGYAATETVETRIAGTATFPDVPEGTHTLAADPGDEDFAPVEREIRVDGDTTIDVEFAERGLREQLCEGVDADMEEVLPEMRPRLEDLFADEGYVSTAMDLPVRDSHAPCLLAAWAEETAYDVCRDGDDVVVYDREQLERELTNVVRYNVEPGDRLTFDELERNFLSAPVPDSVVRDAVVAVDADADVEYSVTTTETAIEVR